jgi:hypothetical protein
VRAARKGKIDDESRGASCQERSKAMGASRMRASEIREERDWSRRGWAAESGGDGSRSDGAGGGDESRSDAAGGGGGEVPGKQQ